jgi:hypothetical protein
MDLAAKVFPPEEATVTATILPISGFRASLSTPSKRGEVNPWVGWNAHPVVEDSLNVTF